MRTAVRTLLYGVKCGRRVSIDYIGVNANWMYWRVGKRV